MLVKAPQTRPECAGAAPTTPTIGVDEWALVEQGPARPGLIAPFAAWLESPGGAGVWVQGDADVEEVAPRLIEAPVVAVRFPVFADGRGLTFAKLLRTRYGYEGELRAFGEIVPDLTEYMYRCGFDAFVMANRRHAEAAVSCIRRMSDHYQGSFRQPLPPYRRTAAKSQGLLTRPSSRTAARTACVHFDAGRGQPRRGDPCGRPSDTPTS